MAKRSPIRDPEECIKCGAIHQSNATGLCKDCMKVKCKHCGSYFKRTIKSTEYCYDCKVKKGFYYESRKEFFFN